MALKSKFDKFRRYVLNPGLYLNAPVSLFRLRQLKDDPIIICGAPRSGTTLLISILDSHRDIISIPYETWLFVNKRPQRWFRKTSWNNRFMMFLFNSLLITQPIKRHHKRWCEKTPDNVLCLDFIIPFFKRKLKVIHIIRDGRDVVLSHHSELGHFMTPAKWVKFVREGLRHKNDPVVLTIRYEDIILDFDKTMSQVAAFLEIENTFNESFYLETKVDENASVINGYGNKSLYKAKPLSQDSLNKWRKNPEVIEQFRSNPAAMKLLEELNYPLQ
jgi:hypothetical protein